MNLLLKRSQYTGWRVRFRLWAKLELTDEENSLIRKYDMDKALLVDIPQPGHMWQSFCIGVLAAPLAYVLLPTIASAARIYLRGTSLIVLAVLIGAIVGYAFYHRFRESVMVRDLMYGKYFKCRSIIHLAKKEAYLEAISQHFRQVLEGAKNWNGTQTNAIEPMSPEDAKRSLLSGPDIRY